MAFQLPQMPNLNVTPPQIANPLDQAIRMGQLKNMLSANALQQQLMPLQVQEEQQRNAQTDIQIQQQELALGNQRKAQTALTDPNFAKDFDQWKQSQSDGSAAGPNGNPVDLHPVAEFLAEKRGLPLMGPNGALELSASLLGASQKAAELAKTQGEAGTSKLKMHADQLGNFDDLVLPVLEETDPAKQAAGVARVQQEIKTNPGFYPPEATQHLDKLGTIQGLAQAANTSKILQMQLEDATKQAQQKKTGLEIEAPSPAQVKTFTTKTIPGFSSLRPEQKSAFLAEAQNARTVDELNKIEERADATDKAEQMHADSMAQTAALKGQAFGQKGLEANDKTWTDPQHGYLATLSQANEGKNAIKAGVDGSGLSTSLAPTMVVLGMNSFAGTHRISPAEAQAAGAPGGWAERMNAWFDKATQGKLSPQLAKEGNQLFDQLIDAKWQASLQATDMHGRGYGIPAQNLPAMERDGTVTTRDKIKAPAAGGGANAGGAASGFTRIKASDGSLHDVPTANLAAARKIDPKLQVVQ